MTRIVDVAARKTVKNSTDPSATRTAGDSVETAAIEAELEGLETGGSRR
jgi:hypothetical protein